MAFPATLSSPAEQERFTRRLEAFSDLVFGFSLSLLATRLDLPATSREIFSLTRVVPFVLTFIIICGMWLEHYRIFRYHFIARHFEIIVNFVFLFGLAVLPFAVQAFIQFKRDPLTLSLYFGDFALILLALSTLRLRGLVQRRSDLDEKERLRDWKRVVAQTLIALFMATMLVMILTAKVQLDEVLNYFVPAVLVAVVVLRLSVRRLPKFLR